MSLVKLKLRRIETLDSTGWDSTLSVECEMSQADMRAALGEFLKHITEPEWNDWLKEFAPEYVDALNAA